jgi:hypothetical protein
VTGYEIGVITGGARLLIEPGPRTSPGARRERLSGEGLRTARSGRDTPSISRLSNPHHAAKQCLGRQEVRGKTWACEAVECVFIVQKEKGQVRQGSVSGVDVGYYNLCISVALEVEWNESRLGLLTKGERIEGMMNGLRRFEYSLTDLWAFLSETR